MAVIDLKDKATLVVEKERAQVVATLSDMLEVSRRSAEEAALKTQEAGITESLAEPARMPVSDLEAGVSLRPQMRPEPDAPQPTTPLEQAIPTPSPISVEELPPIEIKNINPDLNIPEDVTKDEAFFSEVDRVSKALGMSSADLLRAMHFETGGTYSPSIKNPNGSATGLIQFLESTAKSLGTSTEELSKMTREQQMQYVEKYLTPYKGRLDNFGDVYMAIHLPVAVGKDDDYVIYNNTDLRTRAYEANKGLDTNEDGKVTRGEALVRASQG